MPHRTAAGGDEIRLDRSDSIEALREEWRALAEVAGSPFGTWEWASAWWRTFGRDRELLLHVARRRSGQAVAILPLYLAGARGRIRLARFIGHGPSPQLGPVCAPEDRVIAATALRRVVDAELGVSGLLLADRLLGDEGWRDLLGARRLAREPSPVLAIEGRSWDEWLASKSRNFREQVRRRERKLAREHDVWIVFAGEGAQADAAFDTLLRLHEARWGGQSRAFVGARRDFHRDFFRRAVEQGWARLWLLHVDGQPAAAWYGLRYGTADWYCQAGRDLRFERENVGFVLLCHTVRDAFVSGRREYRLLVGGEPYKARFQSEDPGLETLVVSAGPAAHIAAASTSLAARLPQRLRSAIRHRTA